MQRSQFFDNHRVVLKNKATVSSFAIEPTLKALAHLFKRDYYAYTELVEFCENPDTSPEITSIRYWLDISANINEKDAINIILAAVNRDYVLGSPYHEEPRTMYSLRN